jgi:protein-tyrosine-phosphatase/tRNA A37 threonylcarbamoyladenosine synthetase subunit TsaC/SUA5/YrdC
MLSTLDWKNSEDSRDIVHIVVQALVEGRLVVLPADTGYHLVASGLRDQYLPHWRQLTQNDQIGTSSLLLRSPQELLDYAVSLSPVASRMSSRGWPGPLVMELKTDQHRSLMSQLPDQVRPLVEQAGFSRYRVATHEVLRQALRLMLGPLLAAPIKHLGRPLHSLGSPLKLPGVSIVVNDGPTIHEDYSTIVRVDQNCCSVTSSGVVVGDGLHRLAQFVVLLVCTGNTCRSPMAEVILRDKLVQRFGSPQAAQQAAYVGSAGLSAFPGGPASIEAQAVVAQRGLSLQEHQSHSVTAHSLQQADLILTMTRAHRAGIVELMPEVAGKVHLVSGGSSDVSDPFGGSEAVYSACAEQIDRFLDQWLERLDDSVFPVWNS